MSNLPQQDHPRRPPRIRPPEFTPAVLRVDDGTCTPGELELFSTTGGLLSLPKPLDQGCRVKLMFLTQTGTVLGLAEMLRPISWDEQPFRFVSLHENDRQKLRAATQPAGAFDSSELVDVILVPEKSPNAETQAAETLPETRSEATEETTEAEAAPALLPLPSFEPGMRAVQEKEQQWIEKYRTAISNPAPKRRLPRILFALLTLAGLGAGLLYAFQTHLLH